MAAAIHLHPTASLAERVLLPGDPGRALRLAQALLQAPRMFNHNRGLWGYTGAAADGFPVTIQSTGMGGPSAAIVISELADLGARRLLRVGTCGALDRSLGLGDLLIATEALSADGTSRALGAGERVTADPDLLAALTAPAGVPAPVGDPAPDGDPAPAGDPALAGLVVSSDLFYDERDEPWRQWIAAGALAVEMETATLFALAARRGLQAASVLIVSDLIHPTRIRISPDRLATAERRIGELALRALATQADARAGAEAEGGTDAAAGADGASQ